MPSFLSYLAIIVLFFFKLFYIKHPLFSTLWFNLQKHWRFQSCVLFCFVLFLSYKCSKPKRNCTIIILSAVFSAPLIFPLQLLLAAPSSFLSVANFPPLSLVQQHTVFHLHSCCEAEPSASHTHLTRFQPRMQTSTIFAASEWTINCQKYQSWEM